MTPCPDEVVFPGSKDEDEDLLGGLLFSLPVRWAPGELNLKARQWRWHSSGWEPGTAHHLPCGPQFNNDTPRVNTRVAWM